MKKLILVLVLGLIFVGCKVNYIPVYNPIAKLQIEQIGQSTKSFYTDLYQDTLRNFPDYIERYDAILHQISDKQSLDSSRPKNGIILTLDNDLKFTFTKYKLQHQANGTLNRSQVKGEADYIKASVKNIYNTESNLHDK